MAGASPSPYRSEEKAPRGLCSPRCLLTCDDHILLRAGVGQWARSKPPYLTPSREQAPMYEQKQNSYRSGNDREQGADTTLLAPVTPETPEPLGLR
ncbi:hypothetical protein NDU88_001261 [Pleurodeles waltl]|uniref:Uncharacterized protein n=1 Tax=Pleurodeles waltl TaxID=8319 RepID=A0AAV7UVL8_PLEWA|nr:hypothetical protein NDU88_001261 [Pleurodeles waltl]